QVSAAERKVSPSMSSAVSISSNPNAFTRTETSLLYSFLKKRSISSLFFIGQAQTLMQIIVS
ncbi:MAG TPA: hypothetical protein PKK94_27160, partial [Leptospiraceae bacterium]|nr:hypothetical protein [Leptospiraceae bacterium]